MPDKDSTLARERKTSLQRLATLQRMREDAQDGNRPSMLESIEKLIQLETKMLRALPNVDGKPT